MKKFWLLITIILATAAGYFLITQKDNVRQAPDKIGVTALTSTPQPTDITANFEIVTLGTRRIFTSSMYHNLSADVYISADVPSQVHVKKDGVTWADFFATLPMKLTKDCLTTGTKQVFCTNNSQTLKFFVNDIEVPNALDEVIKDGDKLLVTYE